jgi:hypothetical protein
MEIAVHLKEEVVDPTVEDNFQRPVLQIIHGMDNGVFFPVGPAAGAVAQIFFDVPIIGKGAEIHAAAGGSAPAAPKRSW